MAGVSRLQYTTEIRLIRVMCSGRVDLAFVLRAFSKGMDGVFIGGCRLNECNYITHGNYDALSMAHLCRKLLEHIGVNPERLRVEFMSSGEGILFTEVMNDFGKKLRELGPLGKGEGISENELNLKLEAANKLVPYIKLVEREIGGSVKSLKGRAIDYLSEKLEEAGCIPSCGRCETVSRGAPARLIDAQEDAPEGINGGQPGGAVPIMLSLRVEKGVQ